MKLRPGDAIWLEAGVRDSRSQWMIYDDRHMNLPIFVFSYRASTDCHHSKPWADVDGLIYENWEYNNEGYTDDLHCIIEQLVCEGAI